MNTRFVEATQSLERGFNHGKFMVAWFDDEELGRPARIGPLSSTPLVTRCGWTTQHLMVTDLQTGEGAIFRPGGLASVDLDKHRVWVCPMFEPFLVWLYGFLRERPPDDLPELVELPDAEPAMYGYRRSGPEPTMTA